MPPINSDSGLERKYQTRVWYSHNFVRRSQRDSEKLGRPREDRRDRKLLPVLLSDPAQAPPTEGDILGIRTFLRNLAPHSTHCLSDYETMDISGRSSNMA